MHPAVLRWLDGSETLVRVPLGVEGGPPEAVRCGGSLFEKRPTTEAAGTCYDEIFPTRVKQT